MDNSHLIPSVDHFEGFQQNNSRMKPQRLDVHNQHDQSPGELKKKNSNVNICNVHTFYCSKQYINQQHYKPLAHYFPPFQEVTK